MLTMWINLKILIIWKYYSGEALELLCRKGFYPYERVDSDGKLNHIALPTRKEFYSILSKRTY